MTDFFDRFRKIIMRFKRIGCGLSQMRRSACLVVGPFAVCKFAPLFGCTPTDRTSGSVMASTCGYSF